MEYSFMFPLMQKLWKSIKNCKTYSWPLFFSGHGVLCTLDKGHWNVSKYRCYILRHTSKGLSPVCNTRATFGDNVDDTTMTMSPSVAGCTEIHQNINQMHWRRHCQRHCRSNDDDGMRATWWQHARRQMSPKCPKVSAAWMCMLILADTFVVPFL